jgi:hypothetical protein
MAKPRDLLSGGSGPTDSGGALFAGHFDEDADSLDSTLLVTIDSFDPDVTWGPAHWMPRVDDGGAVVLPRKNDKCVVALAESEIPGTAEVWIVAWAPA